MAANPPPVMPPPTGPSHTFVDCVICHRSGMRRITLGHLQYHHRTGELLPEVESPGGDQLQLAYKRLAGLDPKAPMQSYGERLAEGELELYRQDPKREKKLGIEDKVYCRECGLPAYKMTGGRAHLEFWHPTVSATEYLSRWPEAPLRCKKYSEKEADDQVQRRIEDPESIREAQRDSYAAHPEPAKERAAAWANNNKEKVRRASREYQRRRRAAGKVTVADQRKYALEKADKVTLERLQELRVNPGLMQADGICVCLGEKCQGRVIRTHIDKHLRTHESPETWKEYEAKHPGALRHPTGKATPWVVKLQKKRRSGRKPIPAEIVAEVKDLKEQGLTYPAIAIRMKKRHGILRSPDAYEKLLARRATTRSKSPTK